MRTLLALLPLLIALAGCQARLESGGAYAPVDAAGKPTSAPDLQFYQVDTAYMVAYGAIDFVFKFEFDNRALLQTVSPEIQKSLDQIRSQAWQVNVTYHKARDAYLLKPVSAELDGMRKALAKIEQLTAAANAAMPKENQ